MAQNKTVEVFSKLSREQIQKLRDFVASPYYNKNESLLQLFDYLHTLYPDFQKDTTTDVAILKHVPFKCSKGELHNKMTKLLHLTEIFLSLEYVSDPALIRIRALRGYKRLRLSDHFHSLVARLQKELDHEKHRDYEYQWRRHAFEEELLDGFENRIKRIPGRTWIPSLESLDYFRSVKKLRFMCDQVSFKYLVGNPDADRFKQETLDFIKTADLSDLYLHAYSRIYLFLIEEDDKKATAYFFELKKKVPLIIKVFPSWDTRHILLYMETFCSRQANKGRLGFISEFLESIQIRIDLGLLLEENQISPLTYKNVITAGLKLGKFEWIERFIKEYTPKMPPQYHEDFYNYSIAQLRYFQGRQQEAIGHLKSVSHGKLDILLSFAVRKLLMRAKIEIGETELLTEQIEAYKKHLARKKKYVGSNAEILQLFITHLEKLFKTPPAQHEKAVKELNESKNFAEKEWLLQMVRQKKL